MSNAEHERLTRLFLVGSVVYFAAGSAVAFFWGYAVWILLKQDRFLEAAAALLIAPLGAIYGFLRFFSWL